MLRFDDAGELRSIFVSRRPARADQKSRLRSAVRRIAGARAAVPTRPTADPVHFSRWSQRLDPAVSIAGYARRRLIDSDTVLG